MSADCVADSGQGLQPTLVESATKYLIILELNNFSASADLSYYQLYLLFRRESFFLPLQV